MRNSRGFGRRGRPGWTTAEDFRGRSDVVNLDRGRSHRRARAAAERTKTWLKYAPVWLAAVALGGAYGLGAFDGLGNGQAQVAGPDGVRATFALCHVGGGYNCVVDGDTIWLKGEKIRIADIDTPETHDFKCASEKERGDQATQRLRQLLNNGAITLEPIDRDEDQYGRKLRIVLVNGTSVGDTLVGEGLARWYEGGRRTWC